MAVRPGRVSPAARSSARRPNCTERGGGRGPHARRSDDNLRAYTAASGMVPPKSDDRPDAVQRQGRRPVAHNLCARYLSTFDLRLDRWPRRAPAMANARPFEAEKEGYTKRGSEPRAGAPARQAVAPLTVRNLLASWPEVTSRSSPSPTGFRDPARHGRSPTPSTRFRPEPRSRRAIHELRAPEELC